jgi:hypothetical protein
VSSFSKKVSRKMKKFLINVYVKIRLPSGDSPSGRDVANATKRVPSPAKEKLSSVARLKRVHLNKDIIINV